MTAHVPPGGAIDVVARAPGSASGVAVSIILVVCDEPRERIETVLHTLEAQEGCGPLDVVVAAPAAQHLADLTPSRDGRVRSWQWVANPSGHRSKGLNAALARCESHHVVRVDARTQLPPDYVARCVRRLEARPDVGIVGPVQWPTSQGAGARALGIERALRNPWVMGGAKYRRPDREGSADTVYLGAFRRAELQEIGGYDETLQANEDFELAERFRQAGRKVWLESGLVASYQPRETYRALFGQYHAFGRAKAAFWRRPGRRPNGRQVVLLAVAGGLGTGAFIAATRRPMYLVGYALMGGCLMGVVDHVGNREKAGAEVRCHAITASTVIGTAWLSGIARGWGFEAPGGRKSAPPADRSNRPHETRSSG